MMEEGRWLDEELNPAFLADPSDRHNPSYLEEV
jgi:hypothetical protein